MSTFAREPLANEVDELARPIRIAAEILEGQGARVVTVLLDVAAVAGKAFEELGLQVPVVIATPSEVTGLVLDNVVAVMGSDTGEDDLQWVSRLPKMHKIIFVMMDGGWDGRDLRREALGQFPKALYLSQAHLDGYKNHDNTTSSSSSSSIIRAYRKPHYFEDRLEKVAIFEAEVNKGGGATFQLETDFGGHDFPAVAFHFYPYSMPDFETQSGHGGIEYRIASAVAAALNLRLVISPPSTGGFWGEEDPPGSGNYTGKQ